MELAFTWVVLGRLLNACRLTAMGTTVGDIHAERDERCVDAQADY
jgi:hypothetical protein